MNIYHYHPETGVYLGPGAADESPLEPGVFLIPAHATGIAPPVPQDGFVRRFVDGAWGYSPSTDPDQPPTEEPSPPTLEDYENAIQSHVDEAARSKLFRDGVTLASYVASTKIAWAAEAQAFIAWRDQVWAYAYQELARVQGGERAQPTIPEIIAELPAIAWP